MGKWWYSRNEAYLNGSRNNYRQAVNALFESRESDLTRVCVTSMRTCQRLTVYMICSGSVVVPV